jgi:Ni,Fe-hydrogenase III large subunit
VFSFINRSAINTHTKEKTMATTSKNGYEIRSDLLGLAKQIVDFNFQAQVTQFEYKIKKDGDQVVQEFKVPTLEATDIINIAKQFNDFVTNGDVMKQAQENLEKVQELVKPYAEAYQNTVKAFYPNLKNGK